MCTHYVYVYNVNDRYMYNRPTGSQNLVSRCAQVTEVSKAKAYRRSQTAPVRDVLEVPQEGLARDFAS